MKYGMKRQHTINAAKYEGHVVGAWVEIEDDHEDIEDLTSDEEISEFLQEKLDRLLAIPVEDAVKSAGPEADMSHVWDFYKIK